MKSTWHSMIQSNLLIGQKINYPHYTLSAIITLFNSSNSKTKGKDEDIDSGCVEKLILMQQSRYLISLNYYNSFLDITACWMFQSVWTNAMKLSSLSQSNCDKPHCLAKESCFGCQLTHSSALLVLRTAREKCLHRLIFKSPWAVSATLETCEHLTHAKGKPKRLRIESVSPHKA